MNTNFTDILNATSDGTKDFSINALTTAGAANLNGNVTLGNASSDDLTVNASLASSIPVKTTATYNIGGSTTGLAGIYLGANSQTVRLAPSGSMSATYTLTLPVNAGTAGYGLETNGSGALSWKPMQTDTSAKSADYTITDTDGIRTILMTTSTTDRTVTLPTAADNAGRILTIKKVDSASGKCTVDGEGSETIDGSTTFVLTTEDQSVTIQCDGSSWHVLGTNVGKASNVSSHTGNGHGSTNTAVRRFSTNTQTGYAITVADTAAAGTSFTINQNGRYAISYTDEHSVETFFGISKNSSNLTTAITSLTPGEKLMSTRNVSGRPGHVSWTGDLSAGDVIRAHDNTVTDGTSDEVQFYIELIALR